MTQRESQLRQGGAIVRASEADYEDGVRCVVMPCCGFAFDACHEDDGSDPPTYTCPLCSVPDAPTHSHDGTVGCRCVACQRERVAQHWPGGQSIDPYDG